MNKFSSFSRMMLSGCAIAALMQAAPALADDNAPAASNPNDIIVTAQRRSERLEDVPMAITAIAPETMEKRGIRNMQDLGQTVAGVQINYQGSFTYPAIRGISSLTTGIGFENNVGVYIDGFYQPDVTAINADFANLEGVEVLKGPQGSLYGRNATGGAILITTKRPSATLTGKADFRYGAYNDKSASGYLSGPLGNGVRFSVAGFARTSDGYYDSLDPNGVKIDGKAAPMHTYSIRSKLEMDVAHNLTATLGFNYIDFRDDRGAMFSFDSNRYLLPAQVGRLYDPRTFATNRYSYSDTRVTEPTLTLAWDTGIGKVTSYTSQAKRKFSHDFDFDGSYADYSFNTGRYDETTFQQGLDLNVQGVEHLDLVIGANYHYDRTSTNPALAFGGNALVQSTIQDSFTRAYAAFIDGTYHFTDKFSFGFGGRYTSERRWINYAVTPTGGTTVSTQNASVSFNNFSPRGVLTYTLAPRTNIYASISRGFRSGLMQVLAVGGVPFLNAIKPETITSYEVGFKTVQDKFRFDMSAFYYDYSNIQVGLTLPTPSCAGQLSCPPINIIANAKKARVYGVEGQITYTPVHALNINLTASYLDAKYTDFANVTSTGLDASTGHNLTNQVQDWTGQQMARAPSFTATAGIDYTTPLANGSLDFSINGKYTASYVPNSPALYGPLGPAGLQNTERYRQGAYATVNTSINWTDPSDTYTLGLWINNLTNVSYRLSINGSTFGDYGIYNEPRQIGGRFGVKF